MSSSRRVKKGPGRRPLSAKRQQFMSLRERGWSIRGAAREIGISRTTAYRYFPSQRALLLAAHPETGAPSLLPVDPPADPAARLDVVIAAFTELIIKTEAQQRTMLRLSLEADEATRAGLPLRQGRAIAWIAEALEPLRGRLSDKELHHLVLAIRSAVGIEALVWLTDVPGLSREEARGLIRWSVQALLGAALTSPPPTSRSRRRSP